MAEFLEVIDTIKSEEATVQRIFAGEGKKVGSAGSARQNDPRYMKQLAEAATLIGDVVSGKRRPWVLQEAMTTSDFPILFGDVMDRQVLAAWTAMEPTWTSIARRRDVNDFRGARYYYNLLGGNGRLTEVGELDEYPEKAIDDTSYIEWNVKKYGRRMGFSWEAMVNDDTDQLKDIPERFGRAARITENRFAAELYIDANGPHASLYTAGSANRILTAHGAASNNPALSIAALRDAFLVLGNQLDENGEPIVLDSVTLIVPPALEVTAQNILNATQVEVTTDGGTVGASPFPERRLIVNNWMARRLKLEVNPYLPLIATTNGNTSWFVFGNPNSNRPAIVMSFLRGRSAPEVFMKEPNARRVGGGAVNPMDGDFDTDSLQYKVRFVMGGTRVEPRVTVASNGSGT